MHSNDTIFFDFIFVSRHLWLQLAIFSLFVEAIVPFPNFASTPHSWKIHSLITPNRWCTNSLYATCNSFLIPYLPFPPPLSFISHPMSNPFTHTLINVLTILMPPLKSSVLSSCLRTFDKSYSLRWEIKHFKILVKHYECTASPVPYFWCNI
jgi:hypothetical protein